MPAKCQASSVASVLLLCNESAMYGSQLPPSTAQKRLGIGFKGNKPTPFVATNRMPMLRLLQLKQLQLQNLTRQCSSNDRYFRGVIRLIELVLLARIMWNGAKMLQTRNISCMSPRLPCRFSSVFVASICAINFSILVI